MANSGARPWDVGDWLRSLGLGRYEADFSENAIDADILRDLTIKTWRNSASYLEIAADCCGQSLCSTMHLCPQGLPLAHFPLHPHRYPVLWRLQFWQRSKDQASVGT
jgi:hypothetical protein